MSQLNEELLKAVKQYALKHPQELNMDVPLVITTSCGTAGCIAGTACLLYTEPNGSSLRDKCHQSFLDARPEAEKKLLKEQLARFNKSLERADILHRVQWHEVRNLATSLLGLNRREAEILFYFHRNLSEYELGGEAEHERDILPPSLHEYRDRYQMTGNIHERSQIVGEFIDAFIAYAKEERAAIAANPKS